MSRRGLHPNSLRNLRPATGAVPAGTQTGPLITPALRRFAQIDAIHLADYAGVDERGNVVPLREGMTVGELVAISLLVNALTRDGHRDRAIVLDRLDGVIKPDSDSSRVEVLILELAGADPSLIAH